MNCKFYSLALAALMCLTGTNMWAQTHVSTADQLREIGATESVILDNDIDMGGSWSSINDYAATFDGGGFTLTNLGNNALLNTTVGTATIKNLTITGGSRALNNDNGTGVFVNQCKGDLTIQNCVNETPVTGTGWNWRAGGYIGQIGVADVTVDIIDCVNKANVTIDNSAGTWGSEIGGIVGWIIASGVKLNFTRCLNQGNVSNTSSNHTGGFLGYANGNNNNVTFTNCTNSGTITATGAQTGGLMGFISGSGAKVEFINCLNLGDVLSTGWSVGGIAGQSNQATMSFKNCGNTGKISCTSEGPEACPLVGNLYQCSPTATNCWNIGETQGSASALPLISRNGGTCTNCYDKYNDTPDGVTLITDAQVTSGELCFLLNGCVSGGTNAYQTLGTDQYPVYDATHSKIYTKGAYQCDGVTPKTGGTTEYTNNPDEYIVDPHDFVDGICSVCHTVESDENGIYLIGTPAQMLAFKNMTNVATASAKLTADIDMAGQGWTSLSNYAGTFDGQGHTIQNLGAPLINTTAAGATIKDLTLSGSLTTTQQHFGAFVNSSVGNLTLENLINETAITGSNDRVGGIIGGVGANSTVNITNCVNKADIDINNNWIGGIVGFGYQAVQLTLTGCVNTGNITGNQAGIGGIIAQTNNYDGGLNTLINCGNTGNITNRNEDAAGGIIGYIYNSTNKLTNCWNIGQTTGSGGNSHQLIAIGGNNTYTNCYNTEATSTGVTQIQAADGASGALCFLLNGSVSGGTTFYQNLGTDADAYPVLDATHGKVYQKGTVRCDGVTPAEGATVEYLNTEAEPTVQPHNYVEGICDFCSTFDMTFVPAVDGVFQIGTAAQLRWFSAYVNAGNSTTNGALTADIDLENAPFTPIGLFADDTSAGGQRIQYKGTFDGQGHIVKNLTVNDTKKHEAGLFSRLAWGGNAVVKNLGVENANITATHPYGRAGVIAGITGGGCTIENCFVTGNVTVTVPEGQTEYGGISGGGIAGTIKNCWTSYERIVASGGTVTNCMAATAEQLTSGEVAYTINQGAGQNIFFQTLGTDEYPVFSNTSAVVYKTNDAGISTYYGTEAVTFSEGINVYTGYVEGSAVKLTKQQNTIPAQTAVVIEGTYYNRLTAESAPAITGTNDLVGSTTAVTSDGTQYALALDSNGKPAFMKVQSGIEIPAGKAYLVNGTGVKSLSIGSGETGLSEVTTDNGQQTTVVYDLQGRRVANATKGIYIINGKKVMR